MKDTKQQYAEVAKERTKVNNKIYALKKDENVQKYIELIHRSDILFSKQYYLSQKMQLEKYKDCDHLFIYTEVIGTGNNQHRNCGCVKCGLNTNVLNKEQHNLSFTEQLMREYLLNNQLDNYNMSDVLCDFSLAKSIYFKIKENHPEITNEKAIKYLEIALDNIRNIDANVRREKSRAKRLGLKCNFHKWQEHDVIKQRVD